MCLLLDNVDGVEEYVHTTVCLLYWAHHFLKIRAVSAKLTKRYLHSSGMETAGKEDKQDELFRSSRDQCCGSMFSMS